MRAVALLYEWGLLCQGKKTLRDFLGEAPERRCLLQHASNVEDNLQEEDYPLDDFFNHIFSQVRPPRSLIARPRRLLDTLRGTPARRLGEEEGAGILPCC